MRVIKPQRLSVLQRAFEVRGERLLSIGVLAFVPVEAPESPLPEVSMWQVVPRELGRDVALDECMPKPRGEVLLYGKAFSPGGEPRPGFSVRVRVGPVDKTVYAVGKRRWVRGAPTEPEPLTELALGWDKAFGGPGFADNPLGMGFAEVVEGEERAHYLPQLEDPRHLLTSPGQRPAPAAFGALDPTWPARRSKVGTYDARWLENDFPGLARDVDPEAFMLAPLDQRLPGYFEGGEPIALENLHPSEPKLASRAPELAARAFVTRKTAEGEAFEEVAMRLETLVLLPNLRRMIAIFRGVAHVAESDAADVTCLLAALESRGARRSKDHYREVIAQRLDRKRGHLVALRDRDLMPKEGPEAPAQPDEKYSDMPDLLAREGVLERRSRERAQRELDKLRLSARVLGVDPDERGIPRELAPAEEPPSTDHLVEYIERVEAEAARLEADASEQHERAKDESRKRLAEHGVDLDEALDRSRKEGGGPPRFRADEHLARMRETAAIGRALGAPMDDLEAQLDDPEFVAKLRKLEETQVLGYRTIAHHMPPAMLPDEGTQHVLRGRVEAAIASGSSMAGWDLTGADLRGMDLSGTTLREALLERADLRGCTFTGADLSGAVLTRASLDGVRLAGANLEGANLGEVQGKGADLDGARLAKAVLLRADLEGARLRGVDLRAADLFEARLAGADMEGASADEVLFYECDLEGAKLDRASLRKATFFRCRMAGASFVEAILEAAGLVEVLAQGACFRASRANGLRLVSTCDLGSADLTGAELTRAMLRGARLEQADLTGARADGCDVSEADLRGACLAGASLKGAMLVRADLRDADLTGVNLMDALLQSARVHGVSFARANLFRANLMGAEGDARTTFEGAHVVRTLFTRHPR